MHNPMRCGLVNRIALFCAFLPVMAVAYLEEFSPFTENNATLFPLNPCRLLAEQRVDDDGSSWWRSSTFVSGTNPAQPRIHLERSSPDSAIMLSVLNADGSILLAPVRVADFARSSAKVFSADLNGNGKHDYLVYLWPGGVGMAAGLRDVVFVLSDGASYKTTTVSTMNPSAAVYLDLKQNGQCHFIHTTLAHEVIGDHGNTFWVYNLFVIDGDGLQYANDMLEGFPRWVPFEHADGDGHGPNLTKEYKQRVWERYDKILECPNPSP